VCDPQLDNNSVNGEGYHQIYYNATVCRDHTNPDRAKKIANAMQSFPSGHSVAAWAGLFYLSLYLNAHLKIFSNHHPSYWKLLVFLMPLLAATLLVGALYLDMSHNWYDIVVGSLLGTAMAILSYRMCFAAVWDFRWNHVPLVRGSRNGRDDERGLAYSMKEMEEWAGGCATRRAGWGVGRAYACGAPGDCSTAFNVSGNSAHGSHHQQSGPIVDGGGEPGVVA
jgi:diacylglycerol diphosphate phosphatase/phosphatidate phosphatase